MLTFRYTGLRADGRACRGWIEAADMKHARLHLRESGVFVEHLEPARTAAAAVPAAGIAERAVLYRELALLLAAGVPFTEALDVAANMPDLRRLKPALIMARERIREGETPAQVAVAWGAGADECALLEAGERAGAFASVMQRMADFLDQQANLRARILAALTYPAIVAGVALAVAGGLFGIVLPRFARVLVEAQIALPPLTRLMLAAGKFFSWVLPVILLMAVGLFFMMRRRNADGAMLRRHRRYLHLPVVGRNFQLAAAVRFARTFAMLLEGGVPLVEALRLAGRATANAWLAQKLDDAAEKIRHGAGLAQALVDVPELHEKLSGWLRVGEAGGALASALGNAADCLQRRWERLLARQMALLEPLLILLMGGIVLLVALAVLLPMTQINRLPL